MSQSQINDQLDLTLYPTLAGDGLGELLLPCDMERMRTPTRMRAFDEDDNFDEGESERELERLVHVFHLQLEYTYFKTPIGALYPSR